MHRMLSRCGCGRLRNALQIKLQEKKNRGNLGLPCKGWFIRNATTLRGYNCFSLGRREPILNPECSSGKTGCGKIFYPISNAHKIGTGGAIETLFAVKILSKFEVSLVHLPTQKSKVFFEGSNKGSIAFYDTSPPFSLIHIDFRNVCPIDIRCLRKNWEIGSRTFETERNFRRTRNFDIPSVPNLENLWEASKAARWGLATSHVGKKFGVSSSNLGQGNLELRHVFWWEEFFDV